MLAIVKHFTGDTTTLQLLCHRNLVSRWEGRQGGGVILNSMLGTQKHIWPGYSVVPTYNNTVQSYSGTEQWSSSRGRYTVGVTHYTTSWPVIQTP